MRPMTDGGRTLAIFLAIAALITTDLVADRDSGTPLWHVAVEMVTLGLALAGAFLLWRRSERARRLAQDLRVDLESARADVARGRDEARDVLRGLGEAIDRQCDRWKLSPSEREVTLLLLKGLSLKEIAAARATSERTVRQQALSVYRKADLHGRAELSAFFLEDLLLPSGRPSEPGPCPTSPSR